MPGNVKVGTPQGGDSLAVDAGGSITFGTGITFTVTGTNLIVTGLPTADPSVAGALWTNSGVLTRSAG